MSVASHRIENLDDLRQFVYQILCDHNQLEPGIFQMTERILVRAGSPCGTYFCLHGPRSVKFTAIWETDRNTILFYRSTGERFLASFGLFTRPSSGDSPVDEGIGAEGWRAILRSTSYVSRPDASWSRAGSADRATIVGARQLPVDQVLHSAGLRPLRLAVLRGDTRLWPAVGIRSHSARRPG